MLEGSDKMITNNFSGKHPFLSLFGYWFLAGIAAMLIANFLDWLTGRMVPSVVDDFYHVPVLRMQLKFGITIILILVVTLLIDRAYILSLNLHIPNNNEPRREGEIKVVTDDLPVEYVLLSDAKKDHFRLQSMLIIGLALLLLLVGYLAFYKHQQFLVSLNLLIGGLVVCQS